jgi:hypothetical protein
MLSEDNLKSLLRSQNSTASSLQVRTNEKLLAKCPTPSALLERWNPSLQATAASKVIADLSLNRDIPALVDVKNTYGEQTAYQWLLVQLLSLNNYTGVNNGMTDAQVSELAYLILGNYYYLNLMEIAIFFREVKAGKRGQVVWGSKLNTQELMVRLSEFVADRAHAIEKNEQDEKKEREQRGFTTIKQAGAAITDGISGWRRMLEEAKTNYNGFLQMFPKFPDGISPSVWYNAWLGGEDALELVYNGSIPDNHEDHIIKLLCDYNVNHK